jgi:hypothetical protein
MKGFSVCFKLILFSAIVFALYKELFVGGVFVAGGLSYFTIQSNVMVAVSLLLFLFLPKEFAGRSILRGVSLLSITLTGIVYNFVLYRLFSDWGGPGYTLARTVTHIAAPLGFMLDWLLFDQHNKMKWRHLLIWLLYPLVYCAVSTVISLQGGKAIYFFFDAANGFASNFRWIALLFIMLTATGLFYIWLDKKMAHTNSN